MVSCGLASEWLENVVAEGRVCVQRFQGQKNPCVVICVATFLDGNVSSFAIMDNTAKGGLTHF